MARPVHSDITPAGGGAGALIPSLSIAHLVQQRDAVVERIERACALLREADAIATDAGLGTPTRALQTMTYHRRTLVDDPAQVIAGVDAGGWARLLGETGLRSFMDATARDAWQNQIHDAKTPPLTRDNIEATFTSLYEERNAMFERGVVAIFRSLSWNYKTNSPVAFGRRIIVRNLCAHGYLASHGCNAVDDLVRAFCLLDGHPEPDHRQGIYYTLSELNRQGVHEWEGPYFRARWFGNGNGHLTFTRLELIDRLNAILAKHHPGALPAARPAGRRS